MDLRQLNSFLTIAEHGTISRAASVLGIAQPALSRQISLLEQELGTRLFYRHGRGISLTEQGLQFRATVLPLIRELQHAKADVMASAGALAGAISIAMPPSFTTAIGARLVDSFLRNFPHVKLHMLEGYSGHINEWLVGGRVDMAIVNSARRAPAIRMDPFLAVDLFFLSPRSHSAATDGDTISLDQVARGPLILPGRHHGLRREVEIAAQSRGLTLNIVAEVDALAALAELVRLGVAPTILPHGAIAGDLLASDIRIRRIVDPDVRLQFMLAHSPQRPATPAIFELARTLRMLVDEALAEGRLVGRLAERLAPPLVAAADPKADSSAA